LHFITTISSVLDSNRDWFFCICGPRTVRSLNKNTSFIQNTMQNNPYCIHLLSMTTVKNSFVFPFWLFGPSVYFYQFLQLWRWARCPRRLQSRTKHGPFFLLSLGSRLIYWRKKCAELYSGKKQKLNHEISPRPFFQLRIDCSLRYIILISICPHWNCIRCGHH